MMKILILLLAFVCLVIGEVNNNTQLLIDLEIDVSRYDASTLEDAFLTAPQLARKYGYKVKIYTVTTCDGYILEMHRIRSRIRKSAQDCKAPVFLMHGLLGTSRTWVISGRNYSLAYLLADVGYDVWLGNSRGNFYSRKHKTLNPDGDHFERQKYWSFSWHEMGIQDLPTMIDKVLQTTGYEKLHYIGFSQGTTVFWVMTSELPKYNEKIIAMHALAPVAFMSNIKNDRLKTIARFTNIIELVATKTLGLYEIPANSKVILTAGLAECKTKIGSEIYDCAEKAHLKTLGDLKSIDHINTPLPVALFDAFGGGSIICFAHYGQLINSGEFSKFDYGLNNLNKYQTKSPPKYKISKISTPIALYHSMGDKLASMKDVYKLSKLLPNIFDKHLITDPEFQHMSFTFSPRLDTELYERLFDNLKYAQERLC